MLLTVVRVRGDSLAPGLKDGDYVIATGWGRPARAGDWALFDHPLHGRMLKRVERVEPDGTLFVVGEQPDSLDSRRFGPIPRAWVRARVWLAVRRAKP